MHSIRPEKAAKVSELKDLMTGSKGVILVDYCGLTVAEDTDLRRKMREAGVTYMVAKNTSSVSLLKKQESKGLTVSSNTTLHWHFLLKILLLLLRSFPNSQRTTKPLKSKLVSLMVPSSVLTKSKPWQICRAAKSCLPNSSAACRPRFLDSSTSFTVRCVTLFTLSTPFVKRKNRNLPNGWFDSAT